MRDLEAFLSERTERVLAEAEASLARTHLPHYEQPSLAAAKLRSLYDVVVPTARDRRLVRITHYAHDLATEQYAAGIGLGEAQAAINVLEAAIWHVVRADLPCEEQGEALSLVGTILGTVKSTLACVYVALTAETARRSIDLAKLFQGTVEGEPAQR